MSSFTSNTTLYDLLSAILPGYLVLLWMQLSFPSIISLGYLNATGNLTNAIIVFVLSYIVGLVFKILIASALNPILRNRTNTIYSSLLIAEVPETFVSDIRNLLKKENSSNSEGGSGKRSDPKKTLYYKSYYRALKARPNTPIPIMESQVAFLRSMIAIVLIYILSAYWISIPAGISTFSLAAALIILEIIMIFLVIHIQKNIYRIVWEDAYFYETEPKYLKISNQDEK